MSEKEQVSPFRMTEMELLGVYCVSGINLQLERAIIGPVFPEQVPPEEMWDVLWGVLDSLAEKIPPSEIITEDGKLSYLGHSTYPHWNGKADILAVARYSPFIIGKLHEARREKNVH